MKFTAPANSWKTLTEPNGCQSMLPDVKVVPARRLKRPIWLVISLNELFPTMPKAGVPAEMNESTLVFE